MKPITARWGLLRSPEGVADVWEHLIHRTYPPSPVVQSPGARVDFCACKQRDITDECDTLLIRKRMWDGRFYCTQPSQECAHRREGKLFSPRPARKPSPRPRPFADTKRLKAMECYVVLSVRRVSEAGPKHLRPIAAKMLDQHPAPDYAAQLLVFAEVAKAVPDDKPWEAA